VKFALFVCERDATSIRLDSGAVVAPTMRMKGGGLLVRHAYVVLALACLFHSGWVSAAAVPHDIAGVVAAVVNASNLTVHTGEARARIGVVQVRGDSL